MNSSVTIVDVAAVAGVSSATVSLVLNDRPGPSDSTRRKVRDAAESLGYRPDVRARRLRGAPSRCVALITTVPAAVVGEDSGFSFQLALAVPLSRLLMARGYSMLLLPPLDHAGYDSMLDSIDVDAAVIIEPRQDEPLSAALRARGVVTVSVGDVPGLDADAVVERGYSGADVVIGHLVDRGATHIGVLLSSEVNSVSSNVGDFVRAWMSGGNEGSDPVVKCTVGQALSGQGQQAGRRAAHEMLSASEDIDAVYAPTDILALGVLQAAEEMGRAVPGDLLVATNFNGPRAKEASPPLTCLDLDMTAMAEACVGLMVQQMDHPGTTVLRQEMPTPRLLERESTTAGRRQVKAL